MDFWGMAKKAFKNTFINGTKGLIKKFGIGILVFIIIIAIIVGVIVSLEDEDFETDESNITIGKDYVVNTSVSEKNIIITDEEVLKEAINSLGYSNEAKSNLISSLPGFLGIQNDYNVNAVFAMAVVINESSAGTNWAAIDSSTYNWYSFTAGESWTGSTYQNPASSNPRIWRVYNSFSEATYDFGERIANSSYYFGGKNYTVSAIGNHYCPDEPTTPDVNEARQWIDAVTSHMTNIFEACGIDTSGYIDISGSEILSVAGKLFNQVYSGKYKYDGTNVPPHNKVIDCSSFVDWVMYELGYTDFGGAQRTTEWWYKNLNASAYGWTEFYIKDNDISVLQPGDIIVLNGTSHNKITGKTEYRHHMQIFVSAKDATHANVYDCGGESNWSVNTPTKGDSTFWGYVDAKVIRITKSENT